MNSMFLSNDIGSGEKFTMGMFELTSGELMLVSGGDMLEDVLAGIGGAGGNALNLSLQSACKRDIPPVNFIA